jgi:hypothetical protein
MDPLKVAAQFAAYRWFWNRKAHPDEGDEEAAQFSRENWIAFLPEASERMGRILMKIAARRQALSQGPC